MALQQSKETLGDESSSVTVAVNAAVIVFREGLEAVLILAAVTASLMATNPRLRRPVLWGALAALPVTAVLFVLAQTLLDSFSQYGEKLEAVVGLIALAVLLVVMNWFLHKVYWTGWIQKHHARRRRLLQVAGGGFLSAQVLGLAMLGFTSVFREGFETVLFLQALELAAGPVVVLEGVVLGLIGVAIVGVLTFWLERHLPYKKMLIVTGVMIGVVLIVMTGNTVRTMQGVGWAPITSIDVQIPYWAGLWFGIYPTVETIVAQFAAAAFVVGSYFLAERMRKPGKKGTPTPAVRSLRRRVQRGERQQPGGARFGAGNPAELSRCPDFATAAVVKSGRWPHSGGATSTQTAVPSASTTPSLLAVERSVNRRPSTETTSASTSTNAPTGAGARRSTESDAVRGYPPTWWASRLIASSSAVAMIPPCA